MFNLDINSQKILILSYPDAKAKLDMFLRHAQKYIDDDIVTRVQILFKDSYSSKKQKYIDIQFLVKIKYSPSINKEYLTFLTELNEIVDFIGYDLIMQQFTDISHVVSHDIINSIHFKIKV